MNTVELAARILCCPDCDSSIDTSLRCRACGRSFVPEADGIISALPSALGTGHHSKDEIQTAIEANGPGDHGQNIVLFEKAFHDEQAAYYDKLFADPLPLRAYYNNLVSRQIYSYVRGRQPVVDLCCGTGKSSMPLLERGLSVAGMDVSREMLRIYKAKCEAKGYTHVLLVHADASRPPLRPQSCGAIMMIGGLHHIPERETCVKRCCEAVVDEGLFIVHEPLRTGKQARTAVFLENVYALSNPRRVWNALARRIGVKHHPASQTAAAEVEDFTPFETPFTSPDELLSMLPAGMPAVTMRSQGLLSFREFPPHMQTRFSTLLASIIVKIDQWFSESGRDKWLGDAIFGVFRKAKRPSLPQGRGSLTEVFSEPRP